MHKFVLQTFTLLSFTKTVVLDMGQELYWCWEAECDQVNTNDSTSLQITNQNTHKINFATVDKNIVVWWKERIDSGSAPPGHLGAGLADPRRCPGDCGLPGVAPQQGQEGGQWVGQVRNQNKINA